VNESKFLEICINYDEIGNFDDKDCVHMRKLRNTDVCGDDWSEG